MLGLEVAPTINLTSIAEYKDNWKAFGTGLTGIETKKP